MVDNNKATIVVELEPAGEGMEKEVIILEGELVFFNPFMPTVLQIVTKAENKSFLYLFNHNCVRYVSASRIGLGSELDTEFDKQFMQAPGTGGINDAI